jgi:hypothetical protein
MMRRCVNHMLLSLLLLVSQQMAFAHAISHWSGMLGSANPAALQAEVDSDSAGLASALAQEQSCRQCLAFAAIGGVVGVSARQFLPLDLRTERVQAFAGVEPEPRTVCVFHSRAPPAFV